MNNKKKLTIAGLSLAGVAAIGFGSYALFSDSVTDSKDVKVGTVDVELNKDKLPALTHSGDLNNLNPGDNDPNLTEEEKKNRPGTDHEYSFKLDNKGNKSVMTRTVITVSGTGTAGALSTTDLENIIISEKKTYSDKASANDDDKKDGTSIVKLTHTGTKDGGLIYIVGGNRAQDVLSGTGDNAEVETANSATSLSKTFDIGMNKNVNTSSPLMGATISIKIEVQAMQYRNTGDKTWETIFEDTVETKA